MEKRIVLSILVSIMSILTFADDWGRILYVKGVVKVEGKALKVGDQFKIQSPIVWENGQNQVLKFCYDGCTKQRVVTAEGYIKSNSRNISEYLLSRGLLASRAGSLNNIIDLKNYFSREFALIENDTIRIGSNFAMNENNFFFIRFNHNGEMINKKLTFSEDKLIIDKSIYVIDNKPVEQKRIQASLCYYTKQDNHVTTITDVLAITPIESSVLIAYLKQFSTDAFSKDDYMELLQEYALINYPKVYFAPNDMVHVIDRVLLSKVK